MQLIIEPSGNARCIYDEALELQALGQLSITRASHVEPTDDGRWVADLGPVGGPALGPFERRSEALEGELGWIRRYLFGIA